MISFGSGLENPKHLTNLSPGIEIQHTPNADYCSRIRISKAELADIMVGKINRIDYSNFKASVNDKPLHGMYLTV